MLSFNPCEVDGRRERGNAGLTEGRESVGAQELAEGPTRAYGWAKRLLVSAFSESVESQMTLERRGAVEAAQGKELPEGIAAFREKRKATFPPP